MGLRCSGFKRVSGWSVGSLGIALNASHKATDSVYSDNNKDKVG